MAQKKTLAPPLSSALIRQRLSGTAAPRDPLAVTLPPEVAGYPGAVRERLSANLIAAGVLVPIIEHPDGFTILFTRRSPRLRYHAGQVSFPGGRMEPGDADVVAAALRETHEEVGIRPERVQVAGYLSPLPTVSGYAITPIVGLIPSATPIRADPTEVERAFEVPLAFLLDPANQRSSERELYGTRITVIEFRYAAERIWGATASILAMLCSMLRRE